MSAILPPMLKCAKCGLSLALDHRLGCIAAGGGLRHENPVALEDEGVEPLIAEGCPTCGSDDPKVRGAATREVAGRQIPWTCGDAWHSVVPQETEAG